MPPTSFVSQPGERRYTQRYESAIYERVKATTIEQVSREEELSWNQVKGIFDHKFSQEKKDWIHVERVSIDEISRRKGHQTFATVVGDIDHSVLLEVIDSHRQDEIIEVLNQQPIEVREQVKEVSVDMWGGFPKVVKAVFPNAKLVFDHFHVMQPINKELNKVRKQTKMTTKRSKFILLKMEMV
ncbi:MAG: hypothetical protein RLZZ597_1826 [Cyanobacteriota bacterium]|jgi:transposase